MVLSKTFKRQITFITGLNDFQDYTEMGMEGLAYSVEHKLTSGNDWNFCENIIFELFEEDLKNGKIGKY